MPGIRKALGSSTQHLALSQELKWDLQCPENLLITGMWLRVGHLLFGSVKGTVAGGQGWVVGGAKLCGSEHWEGKVLWT